MNRKEFVKGCTVALCASGLCRNAHSAQPGGANQAAGSCDADQLKQATGKLDSGQLRFAGFVASIDAKFDETQRKQIFNGFGHQCAETYRASLLDHYKGNVRGFLEEGLRNWMAEATYDEVAGTIRVVDRSKTCSCPLVKEGATPPSFCDCTLGWQEEAYSTILGRPVHAELEESILRGGKRCVFRMKVV